MHDLLPINRTSHFPEKSINPENDGHENMLACSTNVIFHLYRDRGLGTTATKEKTWKACLWDTRWKARLALPKCRVPHFDKLPALTGAKPNAGNPGDRDHAKSCAQQESSESPAAGRA